MHTEWKQNNLLVSTNPVALRRVQQTGGISFIDAYIEQRSLDLENLLAVEGDDAERKPRPLLHQLDEVPSDPLCLGGSRLAPPRQFGPPASWDIDPRPDGGPELAQAMTESGVIDA